MANKYNKYNAPTQIIKLIKYLNEVLVIGVFYCGKFHHDTVHRRKFHRCSLYFIAVYFTTISHHVDCLFYLLIVVDLSRYKLPRQSTAKTEYLTSTFISLTLLTLTPNCNCCNHT